MSRRLQRTETLSVRSKALDVAARIQRELSAAPYRRVLIGFAGQEYLGPDLDPASVSWERQPDPPAPPPPPQPEAVAATPTKPAPKGKQAGPPPPPPEYRHGRGAFLHPDGRLFDIYYRPTQHRLDLPPVPDASAFTDPDDFEQAVVDWKASVSDLLGAVRLPTPISRVVFRLHAVTDDPEARSRTPTVASGPPRPRDDSSESGGGTERPSRVESVDTQQTGGSDTFTPSSEGGLPPVTGPGADMVPAGVRLIDGHDITVWSEDRWEAQLVPAEPQPQYYDSYELYAESMMRWAALCSQLRQLPPHPQQLADLLGMSLLKADRSGAEVGLTATASDDTAASGAYAGSSLNLWDTLPPETQAKVREAVASALQAVRRNRERFGTPSAPLLCRLHGTLPHPGGEDPLASVPRYLRPLRRTDLTGPMIRDSLDCDGEVDGVRVNFFLPITFGGRLDLPRLASPGVEGLQYAAELQRVEGAMQARGHLDRLYSWYYPLVPEAKHAERRAAVVAALQAEGTGSVLRTVVCIPLHLDRFEQLLDQEKPLGARLLSNFEPPHLNDALLLWNTERDPLVHGKLALLFRRALAGDRFEAVVRGLVELADAELLHAALAMAEFLLPVPPPPCVRVASDTLAALRIAIVPKAPDRFLSETFRARLLNRIRDALSASGPGAPPALPAITLTALEIEVQNLCSSLAGQASSQLPLLLQAAAHRSSSVARAAALGIETLLTFNHRGLRTFLRSDRAKLFAGLRTLAQSRFSHAQEALHSILEQLRKPEWLDFSLTQYVDLSSLFTDFGRARRARTRIPVFAQFLINVLCDAAERASPETVGQIVVLVQGRHELLRWLWARVCGGGEDAWLVELPATAALARLAAVLAEHYLRLRLVGGPSYKPKSKVTIPTDYLLRVDRAEMMRLADWAAACPTTPSCAGEARSYMVQCMAALVQGPGVAEQLVSDVPFFQRLCAFCRDPDASVCVSAWRIVEHILVHERGAVKALIASRMLERLLSVIAPTSPPAALLHGLRALRQFVGATSNMKLPEKTRTGAVKDIRKFTTFFNQSSMFIKFHMVYKRFGEKNASGVFQQLAQLYRAIEAGEASAILREAARDNEEFRLGIERVLKMFRDP